MTQVVFNSEITVEDKYREFDMGLLVYADIVEDKSFDQPAELIINLESVAIDDIRDVTPYQNGDEILSQLDDFTIEFLKDEAVRSYI
jgi:hypothetical protein